MRTDTHAHSLTPRHTYIIYLKDDFSNLWSLTGLNLNHLFITTIFISFYSYSEIPLLSDLKQNVLHLLFGYRICMLFNWFFDTPRGKSLLYSILVCVLATQSCLTLCDPMDSSQPGFSVLGILQARILEWVAIPFSRGSSWPCGTSPCLLHCRQLFFF